MIYTNTTAILAHLIKASADLYRRPMRAAAGHNSDLSEAATVPCEVSHQFYVSERSITQTLRKMGVNFYRCVTPRHLISAKVLIEQGISMEAVAESVGFTDYFSFFRAFQQAYGISPIQYRKMHTNA